MVVIWLHFQKPDQFGPLIHQKHSNYQRNRSAEIVDQFFDLQGEYEKIFDDVQELEDYSERLEQQVDILSGYISPSDWIEIDSINPAVE